MKHTGKVLAFSRKAGGGIILLPNGHTRVFHARIWRLPFPPLKGMSLWFDMDEQGVISMLQASKYQYWWLRTCSWLLRRPRMLYSN